MLVHSVTEWSGGTTTRTGKWRTSAGGRQNSLGITRYNLSDRIDGAPAGSTLADRVSDKCELPEMRLAGRDDGSGLIRRDDYEAKPACSAGHCGMRFPEMSARTSLASASGK